MGLPHPQAHPTHTQQPHPAVPPTPGQFTRDGTEDETTSFPHAALSGTVAGATYTCPVTKQRWLSGQQLHVEGETVNKGTYGLRQVGTRVRSGQGSGQSRARRGRGVKDKRRALAGGDGEPEGFERPPVPSCPYGRIEQGAPGAALGVRRPGFGPGAYHLAWRFDFVLSVTRTR